VPAAPSDAWDAGFVELLVECVVAAFADLADAGSGEERRLVVARCLPQIADDSEAVAAAPSRR